MYEQLLERCRGLAPIPTAVAYPCEETALAGAIDAGTQGLIVPILVGPAATIAEIARTKGIDLGGVQIVDVAGAAPRGTAAGQGAQHGGAAALAVHAALGGQAGRGLGRHPILRGPALRRSGAGAARLGISGIARRQGRGQDGEGGGHGDAAGQQA